MSSKPWFTMEHGVDWSAIYEDCLFTDLCCEDFVDEIETETLRRYCAQEEAGKQRAQEAAEWFEDFRARLS